MSGDPVQEPTDAELHQRIIQGDEEAIAIWYDRTIGPVMKMLVRKGLSPEDAEDVWSEASFEALQRSGELTPLGEGLRKYVYAIAKNLSARLFQQRRDLPTTNLEALERPPATRFRPGEPREVSGSDSPSAMVQRLDDCLKRAPKRIQLVANLKMENATGAEIAGVLDVSIDNAYQIVRRTLAKLKRCIEGAEAWT